MNKHHKCLLRDWMQVFAVTVIGAILFNHYIHGALLSWRELGACALVSSTTAIAAGARAAQWFRRD